MLQELELHFGNECMHPAFCEELHILPSLTHLSLSLSNWILHHEELASGLARCPRLSSVAFNLVFEDRLEMPKYDLIVGTVLNSLPKLPMLTQLALSSPCQPRTLAAALQQLTNLQSLNLRGKNGVRLWRDDPSHSDSEYTAGHDVLLETIRSMPGLQDFTAWAASSSLYRGNWQPSSVAHTLSLLAALPVTLTRLELSGNALDGEVVAQLCCLTSLQVRSAS